MWLFDYYEGKFIKFKGNQQKLDAELEKRNISIHYSAKIDKDCKIKNGADIGNCQIGKCIIEENVKISFDCVIEDGALIGANTTIDFECKFGKNVVIYSDCQVGYRVQIGEKSSIHEHCKIGIETKIGKNCKFGFGVEAGRHTIIGNGCFFQARAKVGDGVLIGNDVGIDRLAKINDLSKIYSHARIGSEAKIGRRSVIGNGVIICDSKVVPNYSVIGKKVRDYSPEDLIISLGIAPDIKGNFTLYKAVRTDLTSIWQADEKYQYKVGKNDSIRNIQKDKHMECGEGFHFTTLAKAIEFGSDALTGKPFSIISAMLNMKDILSISCNKVRLRAYKSVQMVDLGGMGINILKGNK